MIRDTVYIVTNGIYEDEIIEFVCTSFERAKKYVDENWGDDWYWVYEIKLWTVYDVGTDVGLPTNHIVYKKGRY